MLDHDKNGSDAFVDLRNLKKTVTEYIEAEVRSVFRNHGFVIGGLNKFIEQGEWLACPMAFTGTRELSRQLSLFMNPDESSI